MLFLIGTAFVGGVSALWISDPIVGKKSKGAKHPVTRKRG